CRCRGDPWVARLSSDVGDASVAPTQGRSQRERRAARVLADLAAFHRDEEVALLAQRVGHLGVDVGEERLETRLADGLAALERRGDLLGALVLDRLDLVLGEHLLADEEVAEAGE